MKKEEVIQKNINEDKESLEQIGFNVTVVDLKDYFDKREKLDIDFKAYHACCVMGGNVFVLRKAMEYSGFDEYLRKKANEDYLYIGYSAGACVLCKNIEIFTRVDEPVSFYKENDLVLEGIGFIDYVFIPHYQSNYHKVHLIEELVDRCSKKHINYKALKDGETIIEVLSLKNN